MIRTTLSLVCLLAAPLAAEFRRIEVRFSGMQCENCTKSIASRLERMRGVESVKADLAAGRVEVLLKADNTVRLDVVRDTVKNAGFTLGDTFLAVRGRAAKDNEAWRFLVEGGDQSLALAAPLDPGRLVSIEGVLREGKLEVSRIETQ